VTDINWQTLPWLSQPHMEVPVSLNTQRIHVGMEPAGILKLYQRSVQHYGIWYTRWLHDIDSVSLSYSSITLHKIMIQTFPHVSSLKETGTKWKGHSTSWKCLPAAQHCPLQQNHLGFSRLL
jgi:hypothetical protein